MSLNNNIIYTCVNTRAFYQTLGGRIFKSLDELNDQYDIDATVPDFSSITEDL